MTLDGTNTWVIRTPGEEYGVVIDPGPLDEGHLERIAAAGPFHRILITHGHHDHVEGAARLSELTGGTPVSAADPAHCVNSEPLVPGHTEGIQVVATPGHTRDSVCFVYEDAVFTGDTILGRGTTVVAYPDGDLGSYLASLRTLSGYRKMMLPGHGPALSDVGAVAELYLDHRRERLAQVGAALTAGAQTADDIVDVVYPDIDPAVRFAAVASAQAQLDYLRRESQGHPEQLDPL
jgi:glyoxylase-like metal-dependent hydrolase (beta-lactamase superfamily II)